MEFKISKSDTFKDEYCATVVKIGEIFPIEGKDRIVKTMVNGLSIVIGKADFKPGDIAVYCANETVLNKDFLHMNSMYEDPALNINSEQRGYINKYGRLRLIKLGGVPSYGLLVSPLQLSNYLNIAESEIISYLEQHIGEDFNLINDATFIQVYIPINTNIPSIPKSEKRNKKLKRFKMLIDGSFKFHYDTEGLQKHINEMLPYEDVYISTKLHGTSICMANILTNLPTPWYKRFWRKHIRHSQEFDQGYNLIYSSRTVIKNEYINKTQKAGGFYSDDVWGFWANKVKNLIPRDYEVYGEIVGFTPNGTPIQKGYDYGCNPHETEKSKLMIYRMTHNGKECDVPEIINFGKSLKESLGKVIIEYPLMYYGTLHNLYPDIPVNNEWRESVLETLKIDPRFGMEKDEPLCDNKVPREGFVLRKAKDDIPEAWKLKCFNFLNRESKEMDSGNVDMEMLQDNINNE